MSEYSLVGKVCYIVSDNAANMTKAFKINFPKDCFAEGKSLCMGFANYFKSHI